MKRFVNTGLILLLAVSLFSFVAPKGLEDIIRSLHAGNAAAMSPYVDDHIEITLPGKTNTYSRAQGMMVLKDFFQVNGVKSFQVRHKGQSGGSQYCVGTLITRSGNYRTSVFMTVKNGRELLKEIRFYST